MDEPEDISAAFALLGLARTATPAAIDKAYKILRSKWHPDRTGGDGDMFTMIQEAHAIVLRAPPPTGCPACEYTGTIRRLLPRGMGESTRPCSCQMRSGS